MLYGLLAFVSLLLTVFCIYSYISSANVLALVGGIAGVMRPASDDDDAGHV